MNEATLEYVRQHADDDVRQLALRGSKDEAVNMTAALQQIAGLQTARRKLPSWAAVEGVLFPPHLAMEQCSSEQTALYKSENVTRYARTMFPQDKNEVLVDLTGGFGVDFSFMARSFKRAVYVERQEELCQLARHNFQVLGLKAEVICADGVDFLHQLKHASVIFLDPARRDKHGSRTYGIADCTPDVLQLRDELLQKADLVVLKLSPMLDWRKTVNDLGAQWVKEVHIVAVGGECKELLIFLSKEGHQHLRVICVNDDERFEVEEETEAVAALPLPTGEYYSFLYEPNASIMKAGCFSQLARHYGVSPLAHNSHLFVSNKPVDNFPGRQFRVQAVSTMNKRELKEKLGSLQQANITVRNFPLSVAELRKRLKLSEGGCHYIFATTLANGNHVLIVCQR
jgi:hypothetical protein